MVYLPRAVTLHNGRGGASVGGWAAGAPRFEFRGAGGTGGGELAPGVATGRMKSYTAI